MIEWNSSQKTTSFRDPEIGKFDKKKPNNISCFYYLVITIFTYREVASSRPVYYSILDLFGQISPS